MTKSSGTDNRAARQVCGTRAVLTTVHFLPSQRAHHLLAQALHAPAHPATIRSELIDGYSHCSQCNPFARSSPFERRWEGESLLSDKDLVFRQRPRGQRLQLLRQSKSESREHMGSYTPSQSKPNSMMQKGTTSE